MTPVVPFFSLNHFELIGLEERTARCATEVTPWLAGTAELGIPAGALALADCLLSYGATSVRPAENVVTLSLGVELWGSPSRVGTRLTGSASVMPAEGPVLLVHGDIEAGGATVASCTLRAMIGRRDAAPPPAGDARPVTPIEIVPLPAGSWPPPAGPVDEVLALPAATAAGMACLRVGDGVVELSATPGPELARTAGSVHGGAVPILGELACAAALASAFPGVRPRRLGVRVDYLRPTAVGRPAVLRARIVHRSRRVVMTHAEICNAEGKPTARIYDTSVIAGD